MTRAGSFQTNFSRGRLSDRLSVRIDTESYRNGAKELSNVLVFLQGGATTRPGTISRDLLDVTGTPITADGARLEPLLFDRDEAYILCFTDARLDIYRVTTSSIATSQSFTSQPWDDETMKFMTVKTQGSIAVITDNTFKQRILTRDGLDSFTLDTLDFETRADDDETYQPYHKYEANEATLALSGVSDAWSVGTGRTLTSSADFLTSNHEGERFIMRGGEIEITTVASGTSATVEVIREIRTVLDPNPFSCHNGENRVTCTWVDHGLQVGDTVNFEGAGDSASSGINGNEIDGDRTVDEIIDEDRFSFDAAGSAATDSEDFGGSDVWIRSAEATRDWQEPAFSEERGWPQACEFHEQRLWLAGPPQVATGRWGSKPQNFFNFDLGDGSPGDAIKAVSGLGGGQIRHLVSGSDLEVFTETFEAYMPSPFDEGITQENVRSKRQTRHGAAFTQPQRFDGSTLFVDAVGQHVREFLYSDEDGEIYTASPVTALAPDIVDNPYHSNVFDGAATDATPYAIYVNEDGTAIFFHSARQEKSGGWTLQSTDGTFLAFCGIGNRLFVAVTRADRMYIEEFDFSYVARADGCENLSGPSSTSWSATLEHLKSATVDLFDDEGNYLEQVTTDASGNFTTTDAQTDLYVGLPASWAIETLPPALQIENGPLLGQWSVIPEVITFLKETTKIQIGRTVRTFSPARNTPYQSRRDGWARDPTIPYSGTIADKAVLLGVHARVR